MIIKNYTTPSITFFSCVPLSIFNSRFLGFVGLAAKCIEVAYRNHNHKLHLASWISFRFSLYFVLFCLAFLIQNPDSRISAEEIIVQVVTFFYLRTRQRS